MRVEAHLRLLQHPVVAAYVSMRAFHSLAGQLDAVLAELRHRTSPGGRILCTGISDPDQIIALARQLPDRFVEAIDPCAERIAATRAHATERSDPLDNLRVEVRDLDGLQLPAAHFDAVVGLQAIHRVVGLETYWAACHQALAPAGVVLAQEYVGPARLEWPAAQRDAATRALQTIVPAELRPHHERVDPALCGRLAARDPLTAPRSDELLATCVGAGFEIAGHATAGCSLLIPVLIHQIDRYDPRDWNHNHVLARLFAEEARLLEAGTLRDDYAMFVARPRR